jgi:hypothetical protein
VNLPRSLVGPVRCMARPARPYSERIAVEAAATFLLKEGHPVCVTRLAKTIARQVVAELVSEVTAPDDDFLHALATAGGARHSTPFRVLAHSSEIDTHSLFIELRIARMRGRCGRYLSAPGQVRELAEIERELTDRLAGRYARSLRGRWDENERVIEASS